ncbi:thiolase family protein [Longimicrobium terrae]|uniref:acetyl-CoA C-acyltransferase n=1 Tax=Longimicrobium terrae TaxID=1639882 RepID=A0A841H446_9BACT|nr:acetyl-CoA C-acyltransferase [Longimicrobium terrae]MBB4638756.1 acetyl-CoA C-acetyltransferase/3-oxo-5,6-didehydrosuberyl-CoA/3-oxoadipyl-CoA thiolase [Longimicrobium terrae]MBB6072995.1 acetyl-CoA C-acetyltransferase/3-oxo-5,6-didehydrosuberyl-CoA/3-oxoadipyl-CoA thiolase [Longimicrobium terrae]NNC33119.1 acetyl-CoA C-acyltransferase [Longimicrobium terrae]
MTDAFILDACRTPVGRYNGSLASVRPDDLAAHVVRALVERTGIDPSLVDDVIFGCANQAGEDNRNVGRMAALLAGMPVTVAGQTVNRLCGSGLEAVRSAMHAIRAGEGETFIAGGVESMTRAPWVMLKPQEGFARGVPEMADSLLGWRFVNPRMPPEWTVSLGETAEIVAEEFHVSRDDQDAFALRSQQRAAQAIASGHFAGEIVPVPVPQRKGPPKLVETDEHPRADTTLESLTGLKPAFRREGGTVTAGNASGLNDGASALLVASGASAERLGLRPMARIVASAVAGVEPQRMGVGPVPAVRKALALAGMSIDQIQLVELNEAFAAQSVACVRELGIDPEIVNVSGGAVAVGHPLGSSGARILTTLVHEMRRQNVRYGLASMCIGVGQGIAMIVERADS